MSESLLVARGMRPANRIRSAGAPDVRQLVARASRLESKSEFPMSFAPRRQPEWGISKILHLAALRTIEFIDAYVTFLIPPDAMRLSGSG